MLNHYVFFYLSRNKTRIEKISQPSLSAINFPEDIVGYRFFDGTEETRDGKTFIKVEKILSHNTYFGIICSLDDVKYSFPNCKEFISTMEQSTYPMAVLSEFGDLYLLEEGDSVI